MAAATAVVLGTGQVGTFAARSLAEQGAAVLAADLQPDPAFFRRFGPPSQADPAAVDILDRPGLRALLRGRPADVVVLAAGPAEGSRSAPHGLRELAVKGAEAVAETALELGIPRLVFLSSFAVYGAAGSTGSTGSNHPAASLDEAEPLRPRSPYGKAKAEAEEVLERYRRRGLDVVILRPCGVYGPHAPGRGSRSSLLVDRLLLQSLAHGAVALRAPAGVWDEILYVKDLGRAVAGAALAAPAPAVSTFNVGAGRAVTARALSRALREARPGTRVVLEETAGGERRPPLDVRRMREVYGFRPAWSLGAGLADYLRESGLAA